MTPIPIELLLSILSYDLARSDYHALTLASHTLNTLANPHLYHSPEFDTDSSLDAALSFLSTLATNPSLALLVHHLTCTLGISDQPSATALSQYITPAFLAARNLSHLRLAFVGSFGAIVEENIVHLAMSPACLPNLHSLHSSSPLLFALAAHRPLHTIHFNNRRFSLSNFTCTILPILALAPLLYLNVSIQADSRHDVQAVFASVASLLPSLHTPSVFFDGFWHHTLIDFANSVAPTLSRITHLTHFETRGYSRSPSLDTELLAVHIFVRHNPQLIHITPVFAMWARDTPQSAEWTPRPAPFTISWWISRYGSKNMRAEMIKRWQSTGAWIPPESSLHARTTRLSALYP